MLLCCYVSWLDVNADKCTRVHLNIRWQPVSKGELCEEENVLRHTFTWLHSQSPHPQTWLSSTLHVALDSPLRSRYSLTS